MPHSKPNKNAIIHGIYSNCVVLDGEKPEEFSDLLDAFRTEYDPQDVSEEAAVFDLASLHWKKRRLESGLQQALNMQRATSAADASWDSIAEATRAAAESHLKAAEVVCENLFKTMTRVVSKPDEPIDDNEAARINELAALTQQLNFTNKAIILPFHHVAEKLKHDRMERAYNPDIMERELKIHAEIDRRIEKALRRLVMIKEYKKLYVAKSVDSKPIQIEVVSAKPIGEKTGTGG